MRDWKVDQVDEVTRREIYIADDGSLNRIFNVNLHAIDELGEDQEYQTYFTSSLSGALASGDLELVVGLDLRNNDSFVIPVREELQIFEDPVLHRMQKAGFYGWQEQGYAVLNSQRVILGSF